MEKKVDSMKEDKISKLVIRINRGLQSIDHLNVTKEGKIGRIHENLRELHCEENFAPKLVSIGPIHPLGLMEEHKWRLLSSLLTNMDNHGDQNKNGTSNPTAAVLLESVVVSQQQVEPNSNTLRRLVAAMKELQPNARACYEPKTWFDSDEFLMMMLVDGCFVIQLLRLYAKQCELGEVDDPIFRSRWMLPILQRDLLLLENQLPYIVIEKIFNITSSDNERYSLAQLTILFFNDLLPRDRETLNKCEGENEPHHLLGLFRSSFLSSFTLDTTKSSVQQAADCHPKQMIMNKLDRKSSLQRTHRQHYNQQQFSSTSDQVQERRSCIRCATKLKEAGVVFKKRENGDGLLDIQFKDGKLYIPPLLIDDHTSSVLLNFVAYEQCNQSSIKPYFTQYMLFIECLLKSSKDVKYLQSEGIIIDHVLDSNEDVAVLFNKLGKGLVHAVDDCYLSEPVLKHLKQYTQVEKHRRWAKLKEDYAEWKHDHFRSPWSFFYFLAAILLLVFTAIQTVFSVLTYVNPRS